MKLKKEMIGMLDSIRTAMANYKSWRALHKALNLKYNANSIKILKKICDEYKIDHSHFTGPAWNRGNFGRNKVPLSVYISNEKFINSHGLKLKLFEEGLKEKKCEKCGSLKWLEKEIPLELHHMDGNVRNNNLENLQILCPNCHSLTENFRGKNIKSKNIKKNHISDKALIDAINSNTSIRQALISLNLHAVGQGYTRPKRLIAEGKCQLFIPKKSEPIEIYKIIDDKKTSKKELEKIITPKFISKIPTKEKLQELVNSYSMVKIGKMFDVSDNAVRKWCKKLGIIISKELQRKRASIATKNARLRNEMK